MEHGFRSRCDSKISVLVPSRVQDVDTEAYCPFRLSCCIFLILSSLIDYYTKPACLHIPLTISFFPFSWLIKAIIYIHVQANVSLALGCSFTFILWNTRRDRSFLQLSWKICLLSDLFLTDSAIQYINSLHHTAWYFSLLHLPFTLNSHHLGLYLHLGSAF